MDLFDFCPLGHSLNIIRWIVTFFESPAARNLSNLYKLNKSIGKTHKDLTDLNGFVGFLPVRALLKYTPLNRYLSRRFSKENLILYPGWLVIPECFICLYFPIRPIEQRGQIYRRWHENVALS